jgi:uncharacterized protein
MANTRSRPPELALPVASLAALRAALIETVGADAAAHALRAAGYAAGDAFFSMLAGPGEADPGQAPADRFWHDLSRLFTSRGWGQVSYQQAHDGVGSLEASDWVEARTDASSEQPSCHFTTGVLANILGHAADDEVAVLEVECRSRGDQRCRFLFGGADAVYRVYDRIAAGTPADSAVAELH